MIDKHNPLQARGECLPFVYKNRAGEQLQKLAIFFFFFHAISTFGSQQAVVCLFVCL